jgi:FKBP-type peptidyl-prolyl cis-trans isomerase FkpA
MRTAFLSLVLASLGFFSCKKYEKTKLGLEYTFYKQDKDGKKAKAGDVIRIHAIYKAGEDSVFWSTYKDNKPALLQLDQPKFPGDPREGMLLMAEGDSAMFRIPSDTVFKGMPMPSNIKSGTYYTFTIKLLDILDEKEIQKETEKMRVEEEKVRAEQFKAFLAQRAKDSVVIADYAKANKIAPKKTPAGVYYIIDNPGKGDLPKPGDILSVAYKGMLLNGSVFDQSPAGQPFVFTIGQGQVIPAWDDALTFFRKGGKGKIIAPSTMAYGPQDSGKIPANSVLVFEVEVVDIQAAPPATEQGPPSPGNHK